MSKQEQLNRLILSWQDPQVFLDYVWVEDLEDYGSTKFKRWSHIVDLWNTILQNKDVAILKARQVGVSWSLAAYACWKLTTRPYSRTLVISVGEDEAKYFLSHVKFIYRNLLRDTGLGDMIDVQPLQPDSGEAIGIIWDKSLDIRSQVIALPCTGTAGTGYTATDVICDEYDKWRSTEKGLTIQEKNYSALKPPVDRTGGHFIVCSTSEILEPDSFFKKLFLEEDNGFVKRFYGVDKHPKYSEEWFETLCRQSKGKEWQRKQDYPLTIEEALSPPGSERIFPGADQLAREHDNWIQNRWTYTLQPFVPGWRYAAGADVASGHGADFSVLSIIGQKGLDSKVVRVIRSKDLTTYEFAQEIYRACEDYNFPLLAVERNAMGVSVVDDLVRMRYPRLYFKDENAMKKGKPGVDTGQNARMQGPSEEGEKWIWKLAEAVNGGTLKTTFAPQVAELQDFYWIDGKAQARGHDDTVMSLAIANLLLAKTRTYGTMPKVRVTYSR